MMIRYLFRHLLVLLLLGFMAGCGGPTVHKNEKWDLDSQYRHQFESPVSLSCQSAKRALLGQGYTIDEDLPDTVKAHKSFDPEDENMTVLEFTVVCLPSGYGSVLYANAEQSVYRLKKTRDSLGVGVSSLGSIKLPWGKELDSLVKTSGTTIDDRKFYKRFFNLVEEIILRTDRPRYR